jgi:hypothetical protein
LALLHEVVARHVTQHAAEVLLLLGLTVFAVALGRASHPTNAGMGYFAHAVRNLVLLASPPHIQIGLAVA